MTKIKTCDAYDCHNNDTKGNCHIGEDCEIPMSGYWEGMGGGKSIVRTKPPFCDFYVVYDEWIKLDAGSMTAGRDDGNPPFEGDVECDEELCAHCNSEAVCKKKKIKIIILDGKAVCADWLSRTGKTKIHRCQDCGEAYPDNIQKFLQGGKE